MGCTEAKVCVAAFNTLVGWIGLAVTDNGVWRLELGKPSGTDAITALLEFCAKRFKSHQVASCGFDFGCQRIVRCTSKERCHNLKTAISWICDYLSGRTPKAAVAVDTYGWTKFRKHVFEVLRSVPRGSTITYKELAARAGRPKASRAVGKLMASNPVPLLVPCHRVVGTRGLGGFTGGLDLKLKLLELER